MGQDETQNLITIDEIHNTLKKEIQLPDGLQPIPENIYQNIANLIYLLNEQSEVDFLEPPKEDDTTKEISEEINSNLVIILTKLTTLLFTIRCKKIFNSSKSAPDNFDYSNLTDEEKYVFFGNREREKRIEIVLKMLLEGKPKTLERIVSSVKENFILVRFLDSMDKFVGVNLSKYGPYKKDDVAILPFENARSIIENNKAREIRRIV
jgi:DNA replication factor GINS